MPVHVTREPAVQLGPFAAESETGRRLEGNTCLGGETPLRGGQLQPGRTLRVRSPVAATLPGPNPSPCRPPLPSESNSNGHKPRFSQLTVCLPGLSKPQLPCLSNGAIMTLASEA